jgi:hypothetical protein
MHEVESTMSHKILAGLGAAAGAFFAAALLPLVAVAPARADGEDISPAADPGFITATDPLLKLIGVTDIGADDPGENFEGNIFSIPSLGITDVLTSGNDPSDQLAGLGVTLPDDTGIGEANMTINTFVDTMDPALNSSFTIPFDDPLSGLWEILISNDFFGL